MFCVISIVFIAVNLVCKYILEQILHTNLLVPNEQSIKLKNGMLAMISVIIFLTGSILCTHCLLNDNLMMNKIYSIISMIPLWIYCVLIFKSYIKKVHFIRQLKKNISDLKQELNTLDVPPILNMALTPNNYGKIEGIYMGGNKQKTTKS